MLYQLSHVRAHLGGAFRSLAYPAAHANSEPGTELTWIVRHASILVERHLGYRRNMTAQLGGVVPYDSVPYDTDFAIDASLIADPNRSAILRGLMCEPRLPAE